MGSCPANDQILVFADRGFVKIGVHRGRNYFATIIKGTCIISDPIVSAGNDAAPCNYFFNLVMPFDPRDQLILFRSVADPNGIIKIINTLFSENL